MKPYEIIRKIRDDLKYKQEWVADQVGMSQQAYSLIECGHTKLTAELAEKIARVLGIPFADIYQPDGQPSTNEQVLRVKVEMQAQQIDMQTKTIDMQQEEIRNLQQSIHALEALLMQEKRRK